MAPAAELLQLAPSASFPQHAVSVEEFSALLPKIPHLTRPAAAGQFDDPVLSQP
jgi:hypothetical protein